MTQETAIQGADAAPSVGMHAMMSVVGRWLRSRTQTARQLRVIETLSLGPKRSIALLELDGQRFLAGMGSDGVSTLLQVARPTPKTGADAQ